MLPTDYLRGWLLAGCTGAICSARQAFTREVDAGATPTRYAGRGPDAGVCDHAGDANHPGGETNSAPTSEKCGRHRSGGPDARRADEVWAGIWR